MCFAWISEQSAIISLYTINLSDFVIEANSVYCAVRTGSLNQTDTVASLKGNCNHVFSSYFKSDLSHCGLHFKMTVAGG